MLLLFDHCIIKFKTYTSWDELCSQIQLKPHQESVSIIYETKTKTPLCIYDPKVSPLSMLRQSRGGRMKEEHHLELPHRCKWKHDKLWWVYMAVHYCGNTTNLFKHKTWERELRAAAEKGEGWGGKSYSCYSSSWISSRDQAYGSSSIR